MSELDLVRDLYPDRALDPDARDRVRAAVASHTLARPTARSRVRTRWLVPALGAACAVAAVTAVFLVAGGSGTETAEAAGVLRAAAKHARAETSLGQLGPEQYLYTKSTNAYLVTSVEHGGSYSALVPRVREVWLRSDGTGWLLQTAGTPTF